MTTLADVIDLYLKQVRDNSGRTKLQVLEALKTFQISEMDCSDLKPNAAGVSRKLCRTTSLISGQSFPSPGRPGA